jgi:uncharacterized membrane protein YeiB
VVKLKKTKNSKDKPSWVIFRIYSIRYFPLRRFLMLEQQLKNWQPGEEAIANEIAIYQGGWWKQMEHRVPFTITFQMGLSPLWLKHFRFGPLEWLWRSLTYGKMQPMKVVSSK